MAHRPCRILRVWLSRAMICCRAGCRRPRRAPGERGQQLAKDSPSGVGGDGEDHLVEIDDQAEQFEMERAEDEFQHLAGLLGDDHRQGHPLVGHGAASAAHPGQGPAGYQLPPARVNLVRLSVPVNVPSGPVVASSQVPVTEMLVTWLVAAAAGVAAKISAANIAVAVMVARRRTFMNDSFAATSTGECGSRPPERLVWSGFASTTCGTPQPPCPSRPGRTRGS